MEPVHYNFSRICRACKEESNELQPMFENNEIVRSVMNKSFRLAEMLMACASVHVSDDDGLPHAMCVSCVTKLNNAYVFKQQCEITDSFLRLYLQQNAIKEENQLEVDYEVLNVPEIDSSPVTKNATDVENKSQENDKDSDKFSCNVCSKQFQSSSALKFHQKQHDYIHSNLTCKICFKKFNYFSHLQRHMRIHNPQKIYICKICDKRLSRLEHLKRHMITHLKTKPFSCRICKRGFNHSENLYNHERRCKGDRIFVCEVCNRGFSRPDALEAHMSNHDSQVDVKPMLESLENIDKYIHIENFNEIQEFGELSTCFEPQIHILEGVDVKKEISELANSSEISVKEEDIEEETLKKQMKSIAHGDSAQEDPNWAEIKTVNIPIKRKRGRPRKGEIRPSESTKEVKNLINNFHFNTTSKTFNCRICQKEFQRLSHLQRHMLCHGDSKPFGCELCPKTFTRKDHMVRHMKLHTIQKEFKCDLCWREFFREDQLIQHKAIKHDIGEKVISEKKYKCHICHKAFTTEKYRDTHVEAHGSEKHKVYTCKACEEEFKCKTDFIEHEKQNPQCSKRFLCSECGQRFIRKNYLVVHMRRHRGEKPFKCKYCGKGFPRSTDVTRHERYHTGEKNHLCIICGKGFGRAYNLTLHMRTHTGEKPYQCNFCDAAFAQSNDLKSHTRRHTGERYHCDLCNEAFLMGYLLKQHKRNVHGLDLPSQRIQPLKMLPETTTNVDDIKMQ